MKTKMSLRWRGGREKCLERNRLNTELRREG